MKTHPHGESLSPFDEMKIRYVITVKKMSLLFSLARIEVTGYLIDLRSLKVSILILIFEMI